MSSGGCQGYNVIAFCSEDPSLNTALFSNVIVQKLLEKSQNI